MSEAAHFGVLVLRVLLFGVLIPLIHRPRLAGKLLTHMQYIPSRGELSLSPQLYFLTQLIQ